MTSTKQLELKALFPHTNFPNGNSQFKYPFSLHSHPIFQLCYYTRTFSYHLVMQAMITNGWSKVHAGKFKYPFYIHSHPIFQLWYYTHTIAHHLVMQVNDHEWVVTDARRHVDRYGS